MNNNHVAVLGSGTMGAALANAIASAGRPVMLWSPEPGTVVEINSTHRHPRHFIGTSLGETLQATASVEAAVDQAVMVIVAVPSERFRAIARLLCDAAAADIPLLSATKGIEAGTNLRMSEVLAAEMQSSHVGVISGPNMSYDIVKGLPTGIVVAAKSSLVRDASIRFLATPAIRVFVHSDHVGVELAGALKNVVAIGAGIAKGLELGDSFRAMLVALGLRELQALTERLGGQPETVYGMAGIGDLFLSTTSDFSRNHMVGVQLGKGMKVDAVRDGLAALNETAEGLHAVEACHTLAAANGVRMPLAETVYQIVVEGRDPRAQLMTLFDNPLLGM